MRTAILFASVTLLSGCAGMGDAWREHQAIESRLGNPSQQIPPARNYITDPIPVPQPSSMQPSFSGTPGESYQTIMVNTPQGIVYKRCKLLNGQVVACF